MRRRGTGGWNRAALAAGCALALAAPAAADAAGPAAATIKSCKADSLVVAGKVAVTGKAARKVRGANLQIRFHAMPLFGLPRATAWREIGRKTKASGEQEFTALAADSWAGVLSWRFKKGRKTVLAGDERSQPVKVGSTKGRANCTLSEGAKPADTTPPSQYILPADEIWHRGPVPVQLLAQDEFSGVQSVRYSLDGGAITDIRNGTTFDIGTQGAHAVQWAATDVAGNTASRTDTVRVDTAPPSKPALSRPFSVTSSTTPTFQWSASADTGSGMKGYFLAIRRGDGSLAAFQPLDAAATSAVSPTALNNGETYTAVVTAVDNTDTPFSADSDPLTFKVDTSPEVTATDPGDGAVLNGSRKSGNLTVTLDRPADPGTVSATTVSLQRDSAAGGSIPVDPPSCSSPCTTITIHPTSALPEGRYTLTVNGVKSEEGAAIAPKAIRFAVPDSNDEFSQIGPTSTSCSVLPPSQSFGISTTAGNETVLVSFGYTLTGGVGRVQIKDGSTVLTGATFSPPSGSQQLSFSLATAGNHPALSIEYCILSGSGNLTLQNVWASRAP
jgi:hypothetical protein